MILFEVIDKYIKEIEDESILVITSKIISICEGRVIAVGEIDKDKLIQEEAEWFLPRASSKHNMSLTIKDSLILPSSGIDESNAGGYYVLWPRDPQETANEIRTYLKNKFDLKNFGVIITDSKTVPLRWGTTGVAIASSGFQALRNYIGSKDIFGRKMEVSRANIADGLAAAAVVIMGEGREQTPFALISDIPLIKFQDRNPTRKELAALKISIEEDIYAPIIKSVKWKKGKTSKALRG